MAPLPDLLDPADPRPEVIRALRGWLAFQRAYARRPREGATLLRVWADPARALAAKGVCADRVADARDLSRLRDSEAALLPLLSEAFPERLAQLSDPPPVLAVRGQAAALSGPAVAVVGSRAATTGGLAVARELGSGLAAAGLVVVSGLARGIDAAAHRGALEAGGRTVAFLACGPDRVYPAVHRALADQVAASGALVWEQPPGTPPLRPYFPLRNRLLSGMALALVVVEARTRSGSLITASHAANQDLDVFAVPGPVSAPTSEGPNQLLHEGAFVARSSEDVISLLELRGVAMSRPEPRGGDSEPECERPELRRILDALHDRPATRDELARRLDLPPQHLAPDLVDLELEGRVAEDRDGRLRVQPRR